MRFESRELKPYSSPVSLHELKEGSVYFSVNYTDEDLLIPIVHTFIFVGRNLESKDLGRVYFQDVESYGRGVRYESATEDDYAQFYTGPEGELGHIFNFDQALEELMRCSLRRQRGNERGPHNHRAAAR